MTRKEQLALIEQAYDRLPDMQRGLVDEKTRLYRICLKGEVQHRRSLSSRAGISKATAAKLFTVKAIAGALRQPDQYQIVDLLSVRMEFLYAQALVAKFGTEIRTAWAGLQLAQIEDLDYAELMK